MQSKKYREDMESFYASPQWRKLRKEVLKQHRYMCDRCGNNDAKLIVHHKEYLNPMNKDNPEVSLNPDKLEVLCIECHNKEHFKETTMKRYEVMENGEVVCVGR